MRFNFIDVIKSKVRGTYNLRQLIRDGLKIGDNVHIMEECKLDPSHCWLIEIGNNVTLAPRVHILAHDASTKKELNYVRIQKVKIGNNVFIGAGSIILPGVKIGDNVIVGAGSVVSRSLDGNGVYAGVPAKKITDYDSYMDKHRKNIESGAYPVFDETYKIGNITEDKKKEMINLVLNQEGYII